MRWTIHNLGLSGSARPQHEGCGDRREGERQQQRRRHRRDDRSAERSYILPSIPRMPKRGRNTATTIKVANAIGRPPHGAASACSRTPLVPCPSAIRCTMFSVTMIEASTTSPTAIADLQRHRIDADPHLAQQNAGSAIDREWWP